MGKATAVITEDSAFFRRGQIVEGYKRVDDGIVLDGKYIDGDKLVFLKETLSGSDEQRIRDLIKQQLRQLFYNMYTKQSFII